MCIYVYIYIYIHTCTHIINTNNIHYYHYHYYYSYTCCNCSSRPWAIWTFNAHFEVNISGGSGIWDPRIEILRIEQNRPQGIPLNIKGVHLKHKTHFAIQGLPTTKKVTWKKTRCLPLLTYCVCLYIYIYIHTLTLIVAYYIYMMTCWPFRNFETPPEVLSSSLPTIMSTCEHIYIYIERERERQRGIHIYIYIYIYIHITYIHI